MASYIGSKSNHTSIISLGDILPPSTNSGDCRCTRAFIVSSCVFIEALNIGFTFNPCLIRESLTELQDNPINDGIDIRPAFSAAADDVQLYYRTDHHWTMDGGKLAVRRNEIYYVRLGGKP